ncbi:hypothetical protein EBS57_07515 [bacterium]|nr:hypothetical protein [bacterium]
MIRNSDGGLEKAVLVADHSQEVPQLWGERPAKTNATSSLPAEPMASRRLCRRKQEDTHLIPEN